MGVQVPPDEVKVRRFLARQGKRHDWWFVAAVFLMGSVIVFAIAFY